LGLAGTLSLSYENGKRPVPVLVLRKMAEYFRVTTDYLLCLSDDIAHHEVDTSKKYGLSKLALHRLEKLNKAADADLENIHEAINYLLTHGIPSGFFRGISEYIKLPYHIKRGKFKSGEYYEKFKAKYYVKSKNYYYDAASSALVRDMDRKEHIPALNKILSELLEKYWEKEGNEYNFMEKFYKECDGRDKK